MAHFEVTLPTAPSANLVQDGDAQFTDVVANSGIDSAATAIAFGRDNAKVKTNRGTVQHYDTSGVPLSFQSLNRFKLEMMPAVTESGDFNAEFDVLALDERHDVSLIRDLDAQFIYYPSSTLFSLTSMWADARSSGEDMSVERLSNRGSGLGDIHQLWTASVSGSVLRHDWRLGRSGTTNSMTVRCDLYSVVTVGGKVRTGALINTGIAQTFDTAVPTLNTPTSVTLFPGVATVPTITMGVQYISKLVFEGGTGANLARIHVLSTADGSVDSMATYGATNPPYSPNSSLSGYEYSINWLTGTRLKNATKVGTTQEVVLPTFTSGVLHTLGNPGTDPFSYIEDPVGTEQTALTNMKASLQTALLNRTSVGQLIAIRIQDFDGVTADRERTYHSVRSATPTKGSLFGMVLTLDYEDAGGGTRQVRRAARRNGGRRRRCR